MEIPGFLRSPRGVVITLGAVTVLGLGIYGRHSEHNPRHRESRPVNAQIAPKSPTISALGLLLEQRMDDTAPSRKGIRFVRTTEARAADSLLHEALDTVGVGDSRQREAIAECAMARFSIDQLTGDARAYADSILEKAMQAYQEGEAEQNPNAGGFARATNNCRAIDNDFVYWDIAMGQVSRH